MDRMFFLALGGAIALTSSQARAADEYCRVLRVKVNSSGVEYKWSAYGEQVRVLSVLRDAAEVQYGYGQFDIIEIGSGYTYTERNGVKVCERSPGGNTIDRDFGNVP